MPSAPPSKPAARLGAKIHDAKDPGTDLGPMFRQVVGTMLAMARDNSDRWLGITGSRDVPAYGFERYAEERSAPGLSDTSGHSREIFAKGLEWLQANAGQPTFLFLHTYEVHYPYTPRGEITPEDSSQRALDSATYDGEIRYLDEQLG